jgi:hypothetical protein
MKTSHERRMLSGNGLIVIVNYYTFIGFFRAYTSYVLFKS